MPAAAWRSAATRAPPPRSRARRERADEVLRRAGGASRSAGRRRGLGERALPRPYLRDALLDAGVLAETLETASFWSIAAAPLRRGRAPRSLTARGRRRWSSATFRTCTRPAPRCTSPSHCAQDDDPLAHWRRAKGAASDAIIAAGGTISHHHGVGVDHRAWMTAGVGALGIEALRAVKADSIRQGSSTRDTLALNSRGSRYEVDT